jgi:tRNA nucleotidyltransferase/poly(A) polymerase
MPSDLPERAPTENSSPYTGRWVARLRGKIIAQGATREEARRAALLIRPKENPEIIYMSPAPYTNLPLINSVLAVLPGNEPIYLVGGAVRDLLINRSTHDLDFVVALDALKVARKVANALGAAYYPLDVENDAGRVILTNADGSRDVLDFCSYRGKDLEADLHARDFTINAIALDPRAQSLIDPLDGVADLKGKCIRACSESTFSDDPLRILRAIRQATALGFGINPETQTLIKQAIGMLNKPSPERLRDEVFKILDGPKPATSIRLLDRLGILPYVMPELPAMKGVKQSPPHVHDVWEHTLRALDYLDDILAALSSEFDAESGNDLLTGLLTLQLGRYREQLGRHLAKAPDAERSPRALLFFAALYHDIAKPLTMKIESNRIRFLGHDERGVEVVEMRSLALRLSKDEIDHLRIMVREHMRVHLLSDRLLKEAAQPSRKAIYRFFRDTGETGVDLCLLAMADQRATYDHGLPQQNWQACLEVCRLLLENWWEKPAETVNGNELMDILGIKPGPELGQLIDSIREAQAIGEVANREDALSFARGWLAGKNSA